MASRQCGVRSLPAWARATRHDVARIYAAVSMYSWKSTIFPWLYLRTPAHSYFRDLIAFVGAASALASFAAAQQQKMRTIGVLVVGSPASERFWRLFQQDMRELGYIEGRNVRYEFRSDMGEATRLPALAEELVRLKVDLIVGLVHAGSPRR